MKPMLAKLRAELPLGDFLYEPKWDGFRCLVFRDGEQLELQSRNEKPLNRYFPELERALAERLPARCALDGEIVIATPKGLDFDALLQRIHPAASRVKKLAEETPASFVAFDLLSLDGEELSQRPFRDRRALLEEKIRARAPLLLSPISPDPARARSWFERYEGLGFDGVIAKDPTLPYLPNQRVMFKVKHQRTADCVIGGYRESKEGDGVGSLLLGLYDGAGVLHHVGVAASFDAAARARLLEEMRPLTHGTQDHPWRTGEVDLQRIPGAPSRWNAREDMAWTAVRPERVAEVAYDYLQGDRFRHVTKLVRMRPDRTPESCTYAQLEAPGAAGGIEGLFA